MRELPSEIEVRETVRRTLDSLPADLSSRLSDVAIVVEDRHPNGVMGVYDTTGGIRRIVIFREANPTLDEVRRTVLHEIGHHFGLDERRLHDLGYG